jgi:hypothetical protein
MPTVRIQVVPAWWLEPYIDCLVFFCVLFRTEPDWSKLERIIIRGLKVRAVPAEG